MDSQLPGAGRCRRPSVNRAWSAHGQSKSVNALMPGGIRTSLQRYLDDAEPHQEGARHGVAAHALDPEAAAQLWQASLDTPA